jgi:hypothetical protein
MHIDTKAELTAARALAAIPAGGEPTGSTWERAVDLAEQDGAPVNPQRFNEVLALAREEGIVTCEHDFGNKVGERCQLAPGGADVLQAAIDDARLRMAT